MIEFGPELLRVLTYDEAWLYCVTLTHNGYRDWRIPTPEESRDLGLSAKMFPNSPWCHYSSSRIFSGVTRNSVVPVRTKDD
jgi:hypothetical protein